MAKKVTYEVDIDTKSADDKVEGLGAKLRRLNKELRQIPEGTSAWKDKFNEIDDVKDKLEGAQKASADWIDTLESAGGPVGALGSALNKAKVATTSFGAALKATGIGLIVSLVGGLVAALSQSEETMKKFEPIIIMFEQALNGILEALQPLIDGFIELAMDVMPYVTKAFKVVYSAVTAVFQSLGKIGSAIVKLFKGDFSGAWEDAKSSVTGFMDNYDAATERFEKGAKKMTKTQKENLKQQNDDAKKALEEKLKRMEAEDKIDEAKLKKLKEETLLLAETEQEKLDIERKFAKLAYDAKLKDLDEKMALYKKDSVEYKNLQAEKISAEGEYIAQLNTFKETQKKITEDAAKDKKEKDLKAAEDARGIRLTELQSQFEDLDRKNKLSELDFEQDLERFKQQKDILAQQEATELENEELTGFQKTEIRKKYADARMKITEDEIATEKAAQEAKVAIDMAYLDLAKNFGNLLQEVAGKNKALAIAGVVISQAASIGQIIAQTGLANAKSVAASPLTGGMPWVAINTASAALSIASTIAAAVKSIQQINSSAAQAGVKGGGGTAAAISAPTYGGAPTQIAAPQIQTGVENNPSMQIAQTIADSRRMPVRAYVVSSDITTQQALDRKTNRSATFQLG